MVPWVAAAAVGVLFCFFRAVRDFSDGRVGLAAFDVAGLALFVLLEAEAQAAAFGAASP